jgi:hypothetical protein
VELVFGRGGGTALSTATFAASGGAGSTPRAAVCNSGTERRAKLAVERKPAVPKLERRRVDPDLNDECPF